MKVLFIADLHLNTEEPITIKGFLNFLYSEAFNADALYIIGDLFEVWIGDDDQNYLHCKIALAIKTLVNSGVSCYFIHGNHDFLIGKYFALKSGIIILPQEQVLNIYGYNILIMHGDSLCTKDKKYQSFRSRIYNSKVQKLFLALPLFIRRFLSKKIIILSKYLSHNKSLAIMDVSLNKVTKIMEKYKVQWLIHGHTHQPSVHKLIANGKPAFRVVLGPWKYKGSIAKLTSSGIKLLDFTFKFN